ncbi:4-(cytidine 5'-diphospho)-2-C-methyl-D-erythritol kinase [Pelistega sp. MC2]|uniref:4-(cytidine 5'-diphospho)-2-C-methyl-D-erythritol kinase n=1 Tax=Pelistega sp. MC2 TaxID=1720297 RepID=UPI0008D9EFA2|nr:4-(cytidine 5'-diphospho)-2-C-methyl-D-erythritol kinase [Pelistega sp. MC2]
MNDYSALAPAKLNLFLHVNGRRADGYHQLQSLFVMVNLCDKLDFTVRTDGVIRRVNHLAGIPEESDLVIKAAKLLQTYSQCKLGVDIYVDKTIPSGAGLGGGSSDAATTLMVLNHLWQCGLSQQTLAKLGLELGADVPFFIFGQSAIASGVGEQLTAFELKSQCYLILRPALSIPTALIFKDSDLKRDTTVLSDQQLQTLKVEIEQGRLVGHNDLEPIAFKLYPDLQTMISLLKQQGFTFRMTGSGSCFFMPCGNEQEGLMAKEKLLTLLSQSSLALPIENIFLVRTLRTHPIQA